VCRWEVNRAVDGRCRAACGVTTRQLLTVTACAMPPTRLRCRSQLCHRHPRRHRRRCCCIRYRRASPATSSPPPSSRL